MSSTSVFVKERQWVYCEVGTECLNTACVYFREGRPVNLVALCIQNCGSQWMGLSAAIITQLVCSAAVCRPLSELHEYVTSEGDVSADANVASERVCVRWTHCWQLQLSTGETWRL